MCGDCLWWWVGPLLDMKGLCRKHSPRMVVSGHDDWLDDWAETQRNDGCGDFEKADPEEEASDD